MAADGRSSAEAQTAGARVGVDVGGTFTDLVAEVDGELVTAKVPSTPDDQSEGVLASVQASGIDAAAVTALAHGMTVATNALLTGEGARTALVATRGFTDVVEIGRQARKDLYRLCARHPAPLVLYVIAMLAITVVALLVARETAQDGLAEAAKPEKERVVEREARLGPRAQPTRLRAFRRRAPGCASTSAARSPT